MHRFTCSNNIVLRHHCGWGLLSTCLTCLTWFFLVLEFPRLGNWSTWRLNDLTKTLHLGNDGKSRLRVGQYGPRSWVPHPFMVPPASTDCQEGCLDLPPALLAPPVPATPGPSLRWIMVLWHIFTHQHPLDIFAETRFHHCPNTHPQLLLLAESFITPTSWSPFRGWGCDLTCLCLPFLDLTQGQCPSAPKPHSPLSTLL